MISQNKQIKNIAPLKKEHDMAWVVVNILIQGFIVTIPALILLTAAVFVYISNANINLTSVIQKLQEDVEFSTKFYFYSQLIFLLFAAISYMGMRRGCKYVLKKTAIDKKDFGKIGYWVGLVPIITSFFDSNPNLNFSFTALILGIFVTPRLIKKWLNQFSTN